MTCLKHFTARLILLIGFSLSLFSADSLLWKEFCDETQAGKKTLLPDFSYAGYAHGESPIPDKSGPLFKVTEFGAIPNDGKNDAEAIQKAIVECEKAGGGVVFFPPGIFVINDSNVGATQPKLLIKTSHVVLRGSGSHDNGTILDFPAEMLPEDPKNKWTGRVPLSICPVADSSSETPIAVTGPAPRGTFTLKIAPLSNIVAGDKIVLRVNRRGNTGSSFISPFSWIDKWSNGINIIELHKVTAINDDVITLAEPLMIDVDSQGDWFLTKSSLITHVGIEDLKFRGAWKETFQHHKDWRHDSAWRGLHMKRCEDSWIRRCVFENMNWPMVISNSRQITVEDVDFTGTPGHFGMQAIATYGVLGLRVKDYAGHFHGPSLQASACSTVYHECSWGSSTSFDSHANNPYATLHDQNQGGLFLSGVGGSEVYFPHHLQGFVLWNLQVTGAPPDKIDFWDATPNTYGRAFVQVIMAGTHGIPVTFNDAHLHRNESYGTPVTPNSLWLAQLKKRLGKIPSHFQKYVTPDKSL